MSAIAFPVGGGVTGTGDCNHCAVYVRSSINNSMDSRIESSCLTCDYRPDRPLCDMPAESSKAFDAIKSYASYAKNSVLFSEGRAVQGIYILCDGRARLSICSESGKRLVLRIAGPGEILGLGASLSNSPYEVTAELLDDSQVAFVSRKDLMKFLREHCSVCLEVVRTLSQNLHTAYDRVRTLALVRTRGPRVASRKPALTM
jgi:CRP/FNR family cyclic AMP-dependent transcriptional regulator